MIKLFTQLITVATVTLLAACNADTTESKSSESTENKEKASFDLSAAKSAIEAENVKFMDAFKKGDSAAIASLYSSDGQILPPNSEPVDKAGIAATFGSYRRMGVEEVKLITMEVAGDENHLAETGRFELMGGDNKLIDKGKYIVVWRPENGTWKLHRDIWNSSMPAAK